MVELALVFTAGGLITDVYREYTKVSFTLLRVERIIIPLMWASYSFDVVKLPWLRGLIKGEYNALSIHHIEMQW